MKITLILLPIGALNDWIKKNEYRVKSFQKGTHPSEFMNDDRFRIVIPDNNRDWLDKLRGLYIGKIEKDKDVMISPDQYTSLQAMMNRG